MCGSTAMLDNAISSGRVRWNAASMHRLHDCMYESTRWTSSVWFLDMFVEMELEWSY